MVLVGDLRALPRVLRDERLPALCYFLKGENSVLFDIYLTEDALLCSIIPTHGGAVVQVRAHA